METPNVERTAILALAAVLTIVNAHAQQPAPAYRFTPVLASGATVGGQSLPPDTTIDNTVISDTGAFAATVHWTDPAGVEHTALLTPQRIIASSGSAFEGRAILRITGAALAMNNAGLVAYEASYIDSAVGGITRTGIFIERHFVLTLDTPAGTAADFTLTEDGRIIPTTGTIAPPAPAPSQGTDPQKSGQSASGPRVPKAFQRAIDRARQYSPIDLPNVGDPISSIGGTSKPQATAAPPVQPVTQAAKPTLSCALPAFPMPQEWDIGADVKGPIAAHAFDQAGNNRSYNSPFFGHMASPFRTVQFGPDCKPLLIAIGDTFMRGKFEIWTGSGILTWVQPDGSINLNGLPRRLRRATCFAPIHRYASTGAARCCCRSASALPVSQSCLPTRWQGRNSQEGQQGALAQFECRAPCTGEPS